MKVNELQFGDWFLMNGKTAQLTIEFLVDEGITNENIDIPELKPMELTEEILEANGVNEYVMYDGWNLRLQHRTSVVECGPIISVHEFQHALRLCNMEDVADNLKI